MPKLTDDRGVSKVVGVALMLVLVILLAVMIMLSASSLAMDRMEVTENTTENIGDDTRPGDGTNGDGDGSNGSDGSNGDGSDGDGDGSDGSDGDDDGTTDWEDEIDGAGIIVQAVDSDGNPVAGESVEVYAGTHSTWGPADFSGTTESDGRVGFDVSPEVHAISVTSPWGDARVTPSGDEIVVVTVEVSG